MRGHLAVAAWFLVTVAGLALWSAQPSGQGLVSPTGSFDVGSRLSLPEERRQAAGRVAFTAVLQRPANWGDLFGAAVTGEERIVPLEVVQPPNMTQQQVNARNRRLIDESKPIAAVVALKAAGYPVTVEGRGVRVTNLLPDTPAQGVLQPEDTILAVEGEPTLTVAQLQATMRRHQPGEPLRLLVRRGREDHELALTPRPHPEDPALPLMGVNIATRGYRMDLPFPVDIDTNGVGGPSAGLMFALGILDAVTEGDLTRGHFVAGTGTIDVEGQVGAIGGAREKVIGAEHDRAAVFLVPRANYEEASRGLRRARLVPVERLADAVQALCALPPADATAASVVPAPCREGLQGGLG